MMVAEFQNGTDTF